MLKKGNKTCNINSFSLFENKNSNLKPEARLYNIILMNPSIQHFTILNKDSDNSLENSQENRITRENPKHKLLNEEKDEMARNNEVEKKNNKLLPSRHGKDLLLINLDQEFLRENRNLIKIEKEKTSLKNEQITNDTSLKNRKYPILIPIENDRKKKRGRKRKVIA